MKTSSWHAAGNMPGRIGICLYAPRGSIAGFKLYRALAPTKEMLKMSRDEYEPRYNEILAKLDPQKVWDDLHRLVNPTLPAGSRDWAVEPIMLCYERPPWTATNWCHRTMAARWLEQQLGVVIPEFGPLRAQAAQPIPA